MRIILWILLAFFVFRFIFNFLLPIIRVSRQMKRNVRDFQQQTRQQQKASSNPFSSSSENTTAPPKEKTGDYIDFEEIK
jgi:hypothetical protein